MSHTPFPSSCGLDQVPCKCKSACSVDGISVELHG